MEFMMLMTEFIIMLWPIVILAIIAPLEWFILQDKLKESWRWISMTAIGWILYFIAASVILDIVSGFSLNEDVELTLIGVVFGLLMGFLRGLSIKKSIFIKYISMSMFTGIFSHILSIKLSIIITNNNNGFSKVLLMIPWFIFSLTVFYHTLNTAALIWLFRDTSSSAQ